MSIDSHLIRWALRAGRRRVSAGSVSAGSVSAGSVPVDSASMDSADRWTLVSVDHHDGRWGTCLDAVRSRPGRILHAPNSDKALITSGRPRRTPPAGLVPPSARGWAWPRDGWARHAGTSARARRVSLKPLRRVGT